MNLAQLNVARMRFPLDSPEMKDFVDALPEINALGDASPGFVWRLQGDNGDATGFRPFGTDDVIINLTVWESVEALRDFIYRTTHLEFMRRRREWFTYEGLKNHLVLWPVPVGHTPTIEEAKARLDHLDTHGPTPHAFTLRQVIGG
ncbi:DUF3291 domain-containing protein [Allorhizocola rhizosphaerae]|uniref:DUF3291 domain-containing protein n=1 Tax=Allorhizocola rhizosphaerae TaxID=1872709 RepID=UPI000E3DCF49|nr:DUF3291 domain-containing protein [Allorhizocola rhizosphaerae]